MEKAALSLINLRKIKQPLNKKIKRGGSFSSESPKYLEQTDIIIIC